MEDEDDTEESTDEEEDEEDDEEEDDKNEEDQEFEDEVEAVLQGAETGDVSDKDEDLPESSGGGYVVAVYEGEWFLAEVARDQNNVQSGYTRLEYMAIKGKNAFTQPHKPDVMITLNEDILLEDVCPEPVNSRGCLGLNKSDLSKVTTLMVLVFISSKFSFSFFIPFMSTLNKFSLSFFIPFMSTLNKFLGNWKIRSPRFSGEKCLKIHTLIRNPTFVPYLCVLYLYM
jgi:hypothetical protein